MAEELPSDKRVITVMRAAGKLAVQLGRLVPMASPEEKIQLSCAIGLCATAVQVAMVDTQLAQTLYSQARRLTSTRTVRGKS